MNGCKGYEWASDRWIDEEMVNAWKKLVSRCMGEG